MKFLLSIVGPTASGKSSMAISLARHFQAPVLSVDSVQMYRGLDIGSGKVTPEEMQGVPHYMMDVLNPDQQVTAAEFGKMADGILSDLFQKHHLVVAAGGSGFYLQALVEGLDEMPEIPEKVRTEVRMQFEREGLAGLLAELRLNDPETYEKIDLNNPVRVCRAIEVFRASGVAISAYRKGKTGNDKPYKCLMLGLKVDRKELNSRIDDRIDEMIGRGWLDEVRGLLRNHGSMAPALGSLGYREMVSYIQGKASWEETVLLIKIHTHQFAKRQMTWFQRYPQIHWIEPGEYEQAISWIEANIRT